MAGGSIRRTLWRILAVILVVGLVVAGGFAYLHRQDISDYFSARSFTPSGEILALTNELVLTDTGKRVFFATHPTLDGSQRFNERCADVDHGEGGHVLGCYVRGGIHLFQVTDERLDGIIEVTAAHELLHATHERLHASEREELNASLRQVFRELVDEDPTLAERMSVYSELSDDAFANELHSVLGTEVRTLPDWLEAHYARWFSDRSALIDRFEAYRDVFDDLQKRADSLQAEMTAIREDVEARSAAYEKAVDQYNADVQDFNRRNAAYEFSDDEALFWQIRGELERRAAALNSEHDAITAETNRYEEMRQELEALSATSQELNEHLDSNLAPPVVPASV